MPDPDNPSATLEKAKRIADGLHFACRIPDKKPDFTACGGPAAEAYWDYFTPARIFSLVAALEAVLKQADEWATERPGEVGPGYNATRACGRSVREAITRELTGKEEP